MWINFDHIVGESITTTQLVKVYEAEMSCHQIVIDSAAYLLKINLPLSNIAAMSLNDINPLH